MGSRKVAASCPERIKPQLLTMASRPPSGGDWRYEIKFDGYRMLARIESGVALYTRNGYDWTRRMPRLARDLEQLPVESAWIDGEVVIQDDEGRPTFQPLQVAFSSGKTDAIVYFAFDLLWINGIDLRPRPVEQRRQLLSELLALCALDRVRFSETLDVDPHHLLENICRFQMEGVVGKRVGSAYTGERDGNWIKVKCDNRSEFIIVGFTRATAGIGSLLIGLHDDAGQLVYAGRVRSGFNSRTLKLLRGKLAALEQPQSPLQVLPTLAKGLTVVWVAPQLVCEVKYAEITPSGRARHAVFCELREDKSAAEISLQMDSPEPP
jgi:bifunctional non-homologous end joining protein LigD